MVEWRTTSAPCGVSQHSGVQVLSQGKHIARGLLTSGTLRHYIDDFPVTGLTSNPSIFDLAIANSIEDLRQAADLSRPKAGIDAEQLATDLQREGADAFVESWNDLLKQIGSKNATLKAAGYDLYDNSATSSHHRPSPRAPSLEGAG
jgi:transaldolase